MNNQIWTTPNRLTLLRLFFIPFINIALMEQHYRAALVLVVIAGLSDGLDGLAARLLHQKTKLGEYLDPIADKLLLSSLFLSMSFSRLIAWRYTVMVFSRDAGILVISGALYVCGLRDFRPSIFGKMNTACQIAAVFCTLLAQLAAYPWIDISRQLLLYWVFAFCLASAIHYVYLTGQRLRQVPPLLR